MRISESRLRSIIREVIKENDHFASDVWIGDNDYREDQDYKYDKEFYTSGRDYFSGDEHGMTRVGHKIHDIADSIVDDGRELSKEEINDMCNSECTDEFFSQHVEYICDHVYELVKDKGMAQEEFDA